MNEDQQLNCSWSVKGSPCGEPFIYTGKDQAFYAESGFNPPKYCRAHREERKRLQQQRVDAQERRDHSPFKPILDEMTDKNHE